jgi:hypothetical protein
MVFWEHQLHRTLLWCKEVEQEMSTFHVWEKRVGPAPVAQKRRHDSIKLCLTGWRQQAKWKDMGGLSAKDKLTSQELY